MSEQAGAVEDIDVRLCQTMRQRGDGPTSCSRMLRKLEDSCRATPEMVTGWRDGVHRPQSKNRRAVDLYFELAEGRDAGADQLPTFDESVLHLTAEPLLGGRQAALVDVVTAALANSDVNEHFSEERRWVAQVLGLPSGDTDRRTNE